MKLKVVIFTRTWQPEAAQMAWRLLRSGAKVSMIMETKGRPPFKLRSAGKFFKFLSKAGFAYAAGLFVRGLQIRIQFWMRRYLKSRYSNTIYRSAEELALDYPVRIFKVKNQKDEETRRILSELKPDAGIVMNGRRPSGEILERARLGFYGLHLGDLEKYSGADPVFWALASGERQITATVYRLSVPGDSDKIAAWRTFAIFPFDDLQTLQEKALWYGTWLTVQALQEIELGIAGPLTPLAGKAAFFSWPARKTRRELQNRLKKEKKNLVPSAGEQPRVLHVITRMVRGGAQKNTLSTVNGLLQKGYSVTLASGPSWGDEDEILHEALEKDLEVMILPELVREISPLADIKTVLRLRDLMRWYSFAIVHTHTSKAGFLGRIAAHWAKTPIVVHTPHGHVFHSYFPNWKEKIFVWLERLAAHWTHKLVALTVQCRKEHRALGVGAREQWAVIPSGVEEKSIEDFSACREEILGELKILPGRKVIGYIGRLAPVKGCSFLIRSLLPLYWAKFDFHCLIVGDGEQREELENLASAIGLKGRVTFAGYQKDISKFLSVFDVLVVPSLNEGMGRVIVEAGFLAKPVIATNVGGMPDLIENEKTGLLVPARNPDMIAGAVIYLLENPLKAAEFGGGLQRKMLEGFTESQMVEKIHQLYQELLTEKQTGGLNKNKNSRTEETNTPPAPAALEEQTALKEEAH